MCVSVCVSSQGEDVIPTSASSGQKDAFESHAFFKETADQVELMTTAAATKVVNMDTVMKPLI